MYKAIYPAHLSACETPCSMSDCLLDASPEDTEVPIIARGQPAAQQTTSMTADQESPRDTPRAEQAHHLSTDTSKHHILPECPRPVTADPCAAMSYQTFSTAVGPTAQTSWGSHPHMMPFMTPMVPPGMVLVTQTAPWMSYIPVSLHPSPPVDVGAAEQRAEARRIRHARFRQKKSALSCRKAVRYESRKRYADSRPRVNGRFIRKSDCTPAARAGAA